jgi:hypothetical protein
MMMIDMNTPANSQRVPEMNPPKMNQRMFRRVRMGLVSVGRRI